MGITAKVICDSISLEGKRITSLQLKFHRFILPEFNTHRVFSRNASSSRAIPVSKMLDQVRNNPAMPVHWGKNQPGMKAREQLSGEEYEQSKSYWLQAAQQAADLAEEMNAVGLHKQVANRILEPFQHIHVIVTSTEWDNFFALRDHPDAQPEIQVLAHEMNIIMQASTPKILHPGQWHLPYVNEEEQRKYSLAETIKMSAARCARVSYMKHDGESPALEDDLELFNMLVTRPYTDKFGNVLTDNDPIHASPVEHQATPDIKTQTSMHHVDWHSKQFHGNFVGWIQNRKVLEDEMYK